MKHPGAGHSWNSKKRLLYDKTATCTWQYYSQYERYTLRNAPFFEQQRNSKQGWKETHYKRWGVLLPSCQNTQRLINSPKISKPRQKSTQCTSSIMLQFSAWKYTLENPSNSLCLVHQTTISQCQDTHSLSLSLSLFPSYQPRPTSCHRWHSNNANQRHV